MEDAINFIKGILDSTPDDHKPYVIIIIILFVGFAFVIHFSNKKTKADVKEQYQQEIKSLNENIRELNRQLVDKQQIIENKQQTINEQNQLINSLQHIVTTLQYNPPSKKKK